jgi:hypothetical protein
LITSSTTTLFPRTTPFVLMGVFLLKNDGEHDDDDTNDLEEREEVVVWADDDDAEEVSLEMMSVFSISRFNNDRVITPWDRLILSSSSLRLRKVSLNKKSNQQREEILTAPRFCLGF